MEAPAGGLARRAAPSDKREFRGLLAILIAGGIVFPLVGLSLVTMLGLDWGYSKLLRLRTA
ncbi:putative iron-regulated membrane protein [Rhizobium mongolense]|uniref:Putative iron-regulated membrane protein n=1 Tax=Rhizobium mongolense TaxID=57676 RepID=A0A7W6WCB2_9HYPH|nr:putative iron-regulated membrane protein [Rhizobium mongolense]